MTEAGDLSTELLKLLYIFSSSLGLWTCVSIGLNKRCPLNVKQSLILFIGLLLMMPINAYLGLILENPPQLLHSIASTLTWCYGPLMLLLVSDVIQRHQPFAVLAPQFFPFIAFASIHYTKLEWLQFGIYNTLLLVQVLAYLWLTASTLYAQRKRLSILGSEFRNSTYHWILYLVAGLFFILIYDNTLLVLLHLGAPISYLFVAFTMGGISLYISTIALLLLVQPNIFDSKESKNRATDTAKDVKAEITPERHTELTESAVEQLKTTLEQLMEEHKLHLDPSISLSKLAARLDISNHQLSELLNIHLETSFYDYLNARRFKESIRLMNQTGTPQSVTDIAFLSGFNNRNSFYRVFKDNTGLTPGEYRKQALSSSAVNTSSTSEKSI